MSVVVPVWGAEKWLDGCVESLVRQTLREIEIVLVDDGSKDKSGMKCDEWANRDTRIKVIHKENEGINRTRWMGVQKACDEWVAFCDDDDKYELDGLERMYKAVIDGDETDLVIAFPEKPHLDRELDLEECRHSIVGGCKFPSAPWAKLYRKRLLTDDVFDFPRVLDGAEDAIMNTRVLFKTDKNPHFVLDKVYNFRRNRLSVSHNQQGTLDIQMAFYDAQEKSIPVAMKDRYMKEILSYKLNGLVDSAWSEPDVLIAGKHPFLTKLHNEIAEFGYKMNLQEWMLMKIKCRCGLKMLNFVIRAKNSLKYRLGLNN